MTIILSLMNLFLFISLLIYSPLVDSSTTCSIFPSLNCSCFQSNIDFNSTLSRTIYSHLYCQGSLLNEKTFQSPFGLDFKSQDHFRTVSIEFSNTNQIEIHSNQFDSLGMLFSQTSNDTPIDLFLRFNGFTHLTFQEHSLTSTMFHQRHRTPRLWLHLIPARTNHTQIENQFNFSSNSFSGLNVSQMSIYIYTTEDRSSSSSFEHIFNHTHIDELHLHGSIIPPNDNISFNQTFQGRIKSLILHRHVDIIDSNTFPFYSNVYSYTIHSIGAHSMNLSSFVPLYTNLRGLEIVQPLFDVVIHQLIPTLESLTLDIEHLNERTLLAARHIHRLKLGSRLRTIHPSIFTFLSHRLHYLDLSDVDFSQMTLDSRCHLLTYLVNKTSSHLNLTYPHMDNLSECDCTRLFITNSIVTHQNQSVCSKLCSLSDCQVISDYFQEISPNESNLTNEKNTSAVHYSSMDIYSDSIDVDMITFLINQTSEQERNETQRRTTTTTTTVDVKNISSIENIQEYDDLISLTNQTDENRQDSEDVYHRYVDFSWLSFFIGVAVVCLVLLFVSVTIILIVQYRKKHHFKPLPVYI